MNTGKRQPITLMRGKGVRVWDDQGKEYLDFVGGWAICSLGHAHPAMLEAIHRQSGELIQVSNQFYSIPQVQLGELLCQLSGMDRVFFTNSGAEANEGAFKLARKYGKEKRNGAYEIICALDSFHGRTLAAVAATGQEKYQKPFTPLPEGFLHVPYNDLSALKQATTSKTLGVLLEPVQGEGGVNVPKDDYLREVRGWCDRNGLLLILDEVQTGIARLGAMFAFQMYGVKPDILTLAKGMGGGFPIGAFLCTEEAHVFTPGDHGSSYGGNPLACAVSYTVVDYVVKNDLPAHVRQMGAYLFRGLLQLKEKHPCVKEVRGRGLLLALEFTSEMSAAVVAQCNQEGLLLNPVQPTAIRFMPPLIVTKAELDEALQKLDRAIAAVATLNK
jgi:predicted acetylornithine/succinylornithine family transaminase